MTEFDSNVLTQRTRPAQPKTSGLAIASLVCGISLDNFANLLDCHCGRDPGSHGKEGN